MLNFISNVSAGIGWGQAMRFPLGISHWGESQLSQREHLPFLMLWEPFHLPLIGWFFPQLHKLQTKWPGFSET